MFVCVFVFCYLKKKKIIVCFVNYVNFFIWLYYFENVNFEDKNLILNVSNLLVFVLKYLLFVVEYKLWKYGK